jgi:hypothetical protein
LNDAMRETWLKDATALGIDYRFFVGNGGVASGDSVLLNCDDSYRHLSDKFAAKTRWALSQGYDYMHAVQPDCYVRLERLLKSGFDKVPYMGARYTHATLGEYGQTGASITLNQDAMNIVANDSSPSRHADGSLEDINSEDARVGQVLKQRGILLTNHDGFRISGLNEPGPRRNNFVITSHLSYRDWVQVPYEVKFMYEKHREFLES